MKKLCIIILSTFVILLVSLVSLNAKEYNYKELSNLSEFIKKEKTFYKTDNLFIIGNDKDYNEFSFKKIVKNEKDIIYIHYNADEKIKLRYDLIIYIKKESKIETLEYRSEDHNFSLKKSLKNYLKSKNDEILKLYNKNHKITFYSINDDIPRKFVDSLITKTFIIDYPTKGYIVSRMALSEYRASKRSNLYLLKTISTFVPGSVSLINGDDSYYDYYNVNGYVHIELEKSFLEEGP